MTRLTVWTEVVRRAVFLVAGVAVLRSASEAGSGMTGFAIESNVPSRQPERRQIVVKDSRLPALGVVADFALEPESTVVGVLMAGGTRFRQAREGCLLMTFKAIGNRVFLSELKAGLTMVKRNRCPCRC